MPEDDVSDLRDVVDAINKLCETMKTSYDEYEDCEDIEDVDNVNTELVDPNEVVVEDIESLVAGYWSEAELGVSSPDVVIAKPVPHKVEISVETSYKVVEPLVLSPEVVVADTVIFETCKTDRLRDTVVDSVVLLPPKQAVESVPQNAELYDSWSETVNEPVMLASEPVFEKVRTYKTERRSETIEPQKPVAIKPDTELFRNIETERYEDIVSDVETIQCEPMSEMYYTASSEVSLLSDADFQEKPHTEDSDKEKDDRNKVGVMAGHVAAMRERFESMTRTNTPCPDLMRSTSPSFEVFRNFSTSPDTLE